MKQFWSGFRVSFALYSKIPMPQTQWTEASMKYALCFLPLIGVIVGGVELLWLLLAQHLEMDTFLYAAAATAIPVLLTGGIHLDGFTDTCDALSSYAEREKRLEILKDPHVGAFGVMDLAVLLLFQFGLYGQFYQNPVLRWVLALGFPLARCFGGLSVVSLPCAKSSGLAHTFAQASHRRRVGGILLVQALLLLAGMAFLSLLWTGVLLVVGGLLLLLFRRVCLRVFGGVTGDLAGLCITCGETLVLTLCALGALLGGFVS